MLLRLKIYLRFLRCSLLLPAIFSAFCSPAQDSAVLLPLWPVPPSYSFLKPGKNVLSNPASLDSLFGALRRLQTKQRGKVRIVHIGDSHIQADMMTGPIRRTVQALFGNAGRGLVFPYSIAGSNPPADVKSSSNKKWDANRLAHPEKPIACGVSGFGIHNSSLQAFAELHLAPDAAGTDYSFDRVTVFGDSRDQDSVCYTVAAGGSPDQQKWMRKDNRAGALVYTFSQPANAVQIAPCSPLGGGNFSLYGVLLEKKEASGVLYNMIGVNGATFEQYNRTPLFWRGLPQLAADCYILSMGTNEAQAGVLDRDSFLGTVRTMVAKLRSISPKAAIIITTPAGSHRHSGTPNAVVGQVREVLVSFCETEKIACWDLYGATGGYSAAPAWKRAGLMANDGIHYSRKGYEFQAALFLQALESAFHTAD